MIFTVKMSRMILNVTKNHGFTLYLENTTLEKPAGVKLTPPAFLELLKSQGLSFNVIGTGIRHRCLP